MKHITHTTLWSAFFFLCAFTASAADRPNIVWISLEDITPMMGCYGDKYARTPVFDGLAADGVRYTQAHSIAPVCSVSRPSIITGMYPTSLGTHHHRNNVGGPPAFVKMLPNLMRQAGYYTTNNAKKDYNIGGDRWNESSHDAHWRNRPDEEQPFFAVFNYGACHSSITKIAEDVIVQKRLNRLQPDDFHDPAKAPIPPYHPDIPEFRKAWSRYYDAVTQVDYQAGEIIQQLKEDGLWEDTIVFVWADHGVGMPRGKHNAWEQGTHIPLIVRFPEKYQQLAPAKPGSAIDGLVTLMDLGPSTLAMAGLETPLDARPTAALQEWGKLPACQRQEKEGEDRKRDLGLLEETETLERAKSHPSHWELGQSLDNYKRMLDTANLQVRGKAAIPILLARVNDPDSAVRFWAVLGLIALQADDAEVVATLQTATEDDCISVGITAADGLFNLGRYEDGLPAIIAALNHSIPAARIRASCVLDTQPPSANPKLQPALAALAALREAASKLDVKRMRGIPYGLDEPFKRAVKAITGEDTYYRW